VQLHVNAPVQKFMHAEAGAKYISEVGGWSGWKPRSWSVVMPK